MAEDSDYYSVTNAPFFYMKQFLEATELARMNYEQFFAFAAKVGAPRGPVVYFSNTARSGSTLFCHILQTAPSWTVLAEPDFFTLVLVLREEGHLSDTIFDKLVISGLNVQCKNQAQNQTYVNKPESNGSHLLPHLVRLAPSVKHMFSFRKNATKCLDSNVRQALSKPLRRFYMNVRMFWPEFPMWLTGFGRQEFEAWSKVKPRNLEEYIYVLYAAPYLDYARAKDSAEIFYTDFETLLQDPGAEISRIFAAFGIREEFVGAAVKKLEFDAQQNTPYSQKKMKNIEMRNFLSEKQKTRFREIDAILGLDEYRFDLISD